MSDGDSFYREQSKARQIATLADVRRLMHFDRAVYDRAILPFLPANRSEPVYEAATGPGILQLWFKERGYEYVHGSDLSAKEAEMAAEINPAVVHANSVSDLSERFADGSLSTIVALDFFEHLPRDTFRDFLAVAERKLKKGGVLLLRGPNGDSPFVGLNLFNDPTHVWAYTTGCLRILATLAGFTRVEFQDDTLVSVHRMRAVKVLPMFIAQRFLSLLAWAATRQLVRHWGASIYIYATK